MSFVQPTTGTFTASELEFACSLEGAFQLANQLTGTVLFDLTATGNFSDLIQLAQEIEFDCSVENFLRINSDANIFLDTQIDFELEIEPDAAVIRRHWFDELVFDFEIEANLTSFIAETGEFLLNVTILPFSDGGLYFHADAARFYVNDVLVDITSYTVDAPTNSAGFSVSAALANAAERNLITATSTYKFELGKKVDGVWYWRTFISGGRVSDKNFNIGFENYAPTDTVNLSTVAPLADKLNLSPARQLVIYDGTRAAIEADEFETVYDTNGVAYATELINQSNLTLYDLFQEIFVVRCGFSGYKTNIPNFPVRRADFSIDNGYLSGMAGHTGAFEPAFYEAGGELWIIDTTIAFPSGFALPQSITPDNYRQLSAAQSYAQIDGFILFYNEEETANLLFTERTKSFTETSGTFGTTDYIATNVEQRFRDYFNPRRPAQIVKTELVYERKTVKNHEFIILGETRETFIFDSFGRNKSWRKFTDARVPNFDNQGNLAVLNVRDEQMIISYRAHPFKPFLQIEKQITRTVRGMIAIDEENKYLEQNFEQDFLDAHRAGNLGENTLTRFGTIRTEIIKNTPLKTGQVRVETQIIDHVRGVPVEITTEIRDGDIGLPSRSSAANRMLVFETESDGRTANQMDSFAVGEIPLDIGLPLARRMLKKRKSGDNDVHLELTGLRLFADRGHQFEVVVRGAESLGVFLTEGFGFSGTNLGTANQVHQTNLRVSKI